MYARSFPPSTLIRTVWVLPVALCPKTPMLPSGLRKAATLSPVLALEAITRASGEAARDRCARA